MPLICGYEDSPRLIELYSMHNPCFPFHTGGVMASSQAETNLVSLNRFLENAAGDMDFDSGHQFLSSGVRVVPAATLRRFAAVKLRSKPSRRRWLVLRNPGYEEELQVRNLRSMPYGARHIPV